MANIDITISTIAVVGKIMPKPTNLNPKEIEQILRPPFSISESPTGTLISSQKDQIEVIAGGIKLNVRDFSGKDDFTENKIPEIIHYFMEKTQADVQSYGINFIVTVEQDNPESWIANNIISSDISEKIGKTITGSSATLRLDAGQKIINLKIDPNDRGYINIDFNASETATELPNIAQLKDQQSTYYGELKRIINNMGL